MTPDLAPTDRVWVALTWARAPIYHATDHDRGTVAVGYSGHVGHVPDWALTRCGKLMHELDWDVELQRFWLHGHRGLLVPFRLLNLAVIRPCRRCWR